MMQRQTQVGEVIADIRKLFSSWGLDMSDPVVLSDGGNLILWIRPFPIVARVATLFWGDKVANWENVWRLEIEVAHHLMRHQIPVVPPTSTIPAGPHNIAGTWMSLWEYEESVECPPPDPMTAVNMVQNLIQAMQDFPKPLPSWGAWSHVEEATARLQHKSVAHSQIPLIVAEVQKTRAQLDLMPLVNAHGDAHPGNLLATRQGWQWIDFEDASLMPYFWDWASFVANTALLDGVQHPLVQQVLRLKEVRDNPKAFWWTLRARVADSVATNLGLVVVGQGDRTFSTLQVDHLGPFLQEWDRVMSEID